MKNTDTKSNITISLKESSATSKQAGNIFIYEDNPLFKFVSSVADKFGRTNYSINGGYDSLGINFNPSSNIHTASPHTSKKPSKKNFMFVFDKQVADAIRTFLDQKGLSAPLHISSENCHVENGSVLVIDFSKEFVDTKQAKATNEDSQLREQKLTLSNDTVNKLAASISAKASAYTNSQLEVTSRHIGSLEEQVKEMNNKFDKFLSIWESD